MMINDRIQQLIQAATIVSFDTWRDVYPAPVVEIFQQADTQRLYLTDADTAQLRSQAEELTASTARAQVLSAAAEAVVQQARGQVLVAYPGITEEGGDLYPPVRADACWRDFWHFLRCITYGVAAERTDFTSKAGLENLRLLYQELNVPIAAMIWGLEQLKVYGLQHFSTEEQVLVAPYFDHLIMQMQRFVADSY